MVLPIADGLLVVLGVLLVAGRNPFARLPQISPAGLGRFGPVAGAFLYGLLFAPIAIPCSGPFIVAIFAYSLTVGAAAQQLVFFAVFGLGFGLPLLALGLVAQWRGAQITRAIVRWERPVGVVLGLALIAVGAWDLLGKRGSSGSAEGSGSPRGAVRRLCYAELTMTATVPPTEATQTPTDRMHRKVLIIGSGPPA